MKLISSISFVFGLIAVLCTIVNAQDSCTSTLPLKDLTFNTSQCVEGWASQNYILRYAKTDDSTWSFVLSAPDSSAFIGIGFSTNGRMIGSSAIVGWIPPNGSGSAKQYELTGQSPTLVNPDKGDLKIVDGSLKIESVSSRLYLSFQLTADTPRENVLYSLGPDGFFPASDFRLREHQAKVTTTLKYITSGTPASPGTPATPGAPTTPGSPATPGSPSRPPPSPSSAYGLSPSLLFFGISLLALKFY